MINSDKDGWGLAGDMLKGLVVGAAAGAAGAWVGGAMAGVLGSATTLGGAVANGALVGGSGGFAGGFVGGAGNAWMGGASFEQGLQTGLIGGGCGALGGALIGGIVGGVQYHQDLQLCVKGCQKMGINNGNPVPATDEFLARSQGTWYPGAEMDKVDAFTVEHVPVDKFTGKYLNAGGMTNPAIREIKGVEYLTGRSSVYFNKPVSFVNARTLYFNMGHELHHVSQISYLGSLGNTPLSLVKTQLFHDMMESHAYNFRSTLNTNSYQPYNMRYLRNYPDYYWHLYEFYWQNNLVNPY